MQYSVIDYHIAKVPYILYTCKKIYSTNFIFCYICLVNWGKSNIFAWFL